MQKYPDATGNQMIQSLLHNTGSEDHPLEFDANDGFGYGTASLTRVLAADPLQYPDESSLLDKRLSTAVGPAARRRRTGARCGPARGINRRIAVPLCDHGVGVGVLVLIVVGVVVTVVLVRRSNRSRPTNP